MSLFPSRASSTLETSSALPNLPLISLTSIPEERKRVLSTLPSAHFGHARWPELKNAKLKASELRCPRIRYFEKDISDVKKKLSKRPSSTVKTASASEHQISLNDKTSPSSSNQVLSPSSSSTLCSSSPFVEDSALRASQSDTLSDWSACERANLSYQNLHDRFQRDNFQRILGSLDNVVVLVLVNNGIQKELRRFAFDRCRVLHLGKNLIESFADLPKIPSVEEIGLDENHVMDFDGIKRLRSCLRLTTLSLRLNPLVFESGYRRKTFEEIPSLRNLDGVAKQQEDDKTDAESDEAGKPSPTWPTCGIS